jgi:hypothetical protein
MPAIPLAALSKERDVKHEGNLRSMHKRAALAWLGAMASAALGCDSHSVTHVLEGPDATTLPPVEMPQADADVPMPQVPMPQLPVELGPADAGEDAGMTPCERAEQTFANFLAANQVCQVDADCRIINDCGPHGDSFALNVAADAQGQELYSARCGTRGFDGFPKYAARCREGRCAVGERYSCCGCAPLDGGADGG